MQALDLGALRVGQGGAAELLPVRPSPGEPRLGALARGFRGYPVATIAFYGPDAGRASKVAVGIVMTEGEEVADLRRWTSVDRDVRRDAAIAASILEFIAQFEVRTVVMTGRIIGCPHEEGIDYEGSVCPRCEFWANRDRWIGEVIH